MVYHVRQLRKSTAIRAGWVSRGPSVSGRTSVRAYSKKLRRDVLQACDEGGGTKEVVLHFGVSEP